MDNRFANTNKRKKIAMMSGQERPWTNYELGKDCGLVPFLLMKNHGCDAFMVCGKGEEYPYLEKMKGFRVEKLIDNSLESKLDYLENNGKELDVLILYGITNHNLEMARAIKRINNKCILACALDMNPDFTDRVPFYLNPFYDYLDSMDLMWQSDTEMTTFLNEKWYWPVICERNGYYNLEKGTSDVDYVSFDERENTLLYVGRINDEQKNISMLLRTFEKIANEIPDWKLRLVGPIEEPFDEYINTFFDYYPEIRERIDFVGNIEDKGKLHNEYERAKIFVSTTLYEGGTPNAMAEAICTGCVMAITKIGAYRDIIGENETGGYADIGDEESYANMLLDLIKNKDLRKMSLKAYERGKEMYNLEKIVGDIYGRLCAKGL